MSIVFWIVVAMAILISQLLHHVQFPGSNTPLKRRLVAVDYGISRMIECGYRSGVYANIAYSNITDISELLGEYSNSYMYMPVTPAGTTLHPVILGITDLKKTNWSECNEYFYLCVPATGDWRLFNFGYRPRQYRKVNAVSWYYQCDRRKLTDEQLHKEKAYRQRERLPPLN